MIINILTWILISVILIPFGISLSKIFKIPNHEYSIIEIILLGIIPVAIITTTVGFFYRINFEFFIGLSLLATSGIIYHKKNILIYFHNYFNDKVMFSKKNTFIIIIFILITAFQASMPTNIPDDGFYYLQTVKWANLHGIPHDVIKYGFQYGQFSTWHIIQSAFNHSYLFGNRLNNINGFMLIIYTLFFLKELNTKNNKAKIFSVISILLIVIFQFFLTAPSPDLPVFTISIIVFYVVIFKKQNNANIVFVSTITLLALMIKITSFYLILFVLYYGGKKLINKKLIILSAVAIGVLFIKNIIVSGTLLFPVNINLGLVTNSNIVSQILKDNERRLLEFTFGAMGNKYDTLTLFEKINTWLFKLGYKSFVNIIWVIGVILISIFSALYKTIELKVISIISIIHFIALLVIAPYYRFAIPLIFLNYIMISIIIFQKTKINSNYIYPLLLSSIIWLTPLINPILKFSYNGIVSISYPIKAEYLLLRAKPFISTKYEKGNYINEEVFIPPNSHYAWDGPLPCVMRYHYYKYKASGK